jgi:hypothetical protein
MTDLLNKFWLLSESEKRFSVYKTLIRKARPYTLDAAATDLITELASGPTIQDKVHIYRKLARLPFETVWIEIDFMDRWRARQRLGVIPPDLSTHDTPERLGWLLQREGDTQWRATTVFSSSAVDVFGTSFVLSTEGPANFYSHASDPAAKHIVKKMNAFQAGSIIWGFGATATEVGQFVIPSQLSDCTMVDIAAAWDKWLDTYPGNTSEREKRDLIEKFMMESIKETQGDIRFLIAALASLNELPVKMYDTRQNGSVRVSGGIKPYMVNRVVSIDLPKTRVNRAKKAMSLLRLAERHMRAHEVAGYWRMTHYKDGRKEMKWINNYVRGDASLGWVHQEREVTA